MQLWCIRDSKPNQSKVSKPNWTQLTHFKWVKVNVTNFNWVSGSVFVSHANIKGNDFPTDPNISNRLVFPSNVLIRMDNNNDKKTVFS